MEILELVHERNRRERRLLMLEAPMHALVDEVVNVSLDNTERKRCE